MDVKGHCLCQLDRVNLCRYKLCKGGVMPQADFHESRHAKNIKIIEI